MQVAVVYPATAPMRWHLAAGEAIGTVAGTACRFAAVEAETAPAALGLVHRLEALVFRHPADGPGEAVDRASLRPAGPLDGADLVVDLAGTASPPAGAILVRLTCGGRRVDLGAADAVLSGASPVLEAHVRTAGGERRVAAWVIATEDRGVLAVAVGDVLGRAVQLVRLAVEAIADGIPAEGLDLGIADDLPPPGAPRRAAPAFFARSFADKLRHRLGRRLAEAPRWHVGWRPASPAAGLPDLSAAPFRPVPDDGRRFFADPFPWSRDGRAAILMEELPFATGKGILSAVDVGADGALSAPRPILEQDCHLSYPFLVEDGGTLFMIPETSARRTVELWRCTAFPDRWEPEAVLIAGEDLSDATVVRAGNRWLMLAASRERWCSTWDALDVWTAPALAGPWSRAGRGPALVDVRSARPAGAVLADGDRLVRPVQDCAAGYGAGLAFASFTVDPSGAFRQRVLARGRAAAPWSGLHTYNRSAGIEVVDLFGPPPAGPFTVPRAERVGHSAD